MKGEWEKNQMEQWPGLNIGTNHIGLKAYAVSGWANSM